MKGKRLSAFQERRISTAALVDPRTLRKYLAGIDVSPMVRLRIEAALTAEGLDSFVHPQPDGAAIA